jgi:D-arabinose 1-dehydrogenase-like Zn-dependent alcohol dehydrogenase
MHAMVLSAPGAPLRFELREDPVPRRGDVRVKVSACGVCRTDLHVVDGELPDIAYPIVPGHEVVGRVDALGPDVDSLRIGERVGVPWLGYTCGECSYCRAPVGDLVPLALRAVRKGRRVVCAGIHMSDIPSFPYRILWEERHLLSVANLTRGDGIEFFKIAAQAGIRTHTSVFPLREANEVLAKLRAGQITGAAVLQP